MDEVEVIFGVGPFEFGVILALAVSEAGWMGSREGGGRGYNFEATVSEGPDGLDRREVGAYNFCRGPSSGRG
jgi:hypothetical protein